MGDPSEYIFVDGCTNVHFWDVEFTEDGDVIPSQASCDGVRHPTSNASPPTWQATTDEDLVIVSADSGADFILTSPAIVRAEIRRTEDCLRLEVRQVDTSDREDEPYILVRGEYAYQPSMEGCEPRAYAVEEPTCPPDAM